MRILVTGGAGSIGSNLVHRLLASGRHDIVNLDALRYSGNLDNLADVSENARYTFMDQTNTRKSSFRYLSPMRSMISPTVIWGRSLPA